MLFRSFEPSNLQLTLPASMLSICISSMLFTCSFEASNHPIFHSWPVRYLYVLPVCYLHAVSKLQTIQSSIPGQYAIYMYYQYAIYNVMLFQSFEPPNLPFLASMLSIRIASMLRTTQSSIPGQYAIYMYYQYASYMLFQSFEPPNLPLPASMRSICITSMLFTCCFELPNLTFPASMLSIRIASMLFTCCFEASNLPILHSRLVFYLYVLPVCDLHAASKLRTTQSSIPGQYAIYTYSSMPFTCCFEASNYPILHSRPVCYLYVLPVCHLHAASKLRTTFPASMLSIRIASMPFTCCFEASNYPIFHSRPVCYLYVLQYAIYMLLRSFEPPNLTFPASMLSIRIASVPFTCCFEASNHPILHSQPVCYLYVLPVCHLHAASKLRTIQSSIPGQYVIYT